MDMTYRTACPPKAHMSLFVHIYSRYTYSSALLRIRTDRVYKTEPTDISLSLRTLGAVTVTILNIA